MFSEIQVNDGEIQRTESQRIKRKWQRENSKLDVKENGAVGAIT